MAAAKVNGVAHANGTAGNMNGFSNPAGRFDVRKLPSHFIGGNRFDKAPSSKVKDFVVANNGHTVISSVSLHGGYTEVVSRRLSN